MLHVGLPELYRTFKSRSSLCFNLKNTVQDTGIKPFKGLYRYKRYKRFYLILLETLVT